MSLTYRKAKTTTIEPIIPEAENRSLFPINQNRIVDLTENESLIEVVSKENQPIDDFYFENDSNIDEEDENENQIEHTQFEEFEVFEDHMNILEWETESENIYNGSQVSIKNSSFYLLGFMERFNLSIACRDELLKLIQYHLPHNNKVVKSLNKLNLSLGLEKKLIHKRKFCQSCSLEVLMGPLNEQIVESCCSCSENDQKDHDHFLFMDVFDQISVLVKKHFETIQVFLNEPKRYLDLTDGEYYASIKKQNTLHVIIYSDGTPIRKTTKKKQFWPVVIGLAELPLALRESIQNKIICGKFYSAYCFYFKFKLINQFYFFIGVWYGKNKPSSDILFEAITNELSQNKSIDISRNDFNQFSITIDIYGFILDSPGRSDALFMKSHGGYFSCPYCLIPCKFSFLNIS